jgi:hypothetical protein
MKEAMSGLLGHVHKPARSMLCHRCDNSSAIFAIPLVLLCAYTVKLVSFAPVSSSAMTSCDAQDDAMGETNRAFKWLSLDWSSCLLTVGSRLLRALDRWF